ncbi:hypothetical protein ACFLUJ_07295 [Chloroflexota bacterium]
MAFSKRSRVSHPAWMTSSGVGKINELNPLTFATKYQPMIRMAINAVGGMISLRQFINRPFDIYRLFLQ